MGDFVGYVRVSTIEQDPRMQINALIKAGCDESLIFIDKASGANRERPELKRCFEHLRKGDTLVVWKLDRLGRSLKHLLELIEKIEKRGVSFKSLTDPIDTTTSGGKLMFSMVGAFAEFERNINRERILEGLKRSQEAGKKPGRVPVLDSKLKVEQALYMLNAPGATRSSVAEHYGISRTSLHRAIKKYEGGEML